MCISSLHAHSKSLGVSVKSYYILEKAASEHSVRKEISRSQYESLLLLDRDLVFYRDFDRAWRILYINMLRQRDVMQRFKTSFHNPSSDEELSNTELIQRALNVELFNVLSAAYFYFSEFAETNIVRKYGKESEQLEFLKKTTSEYFDRYFEYRFFYKLRNYAVHCGLPIQIVRRVYVEREVNHKEEFAIWFDCPHLLRSYDSWGRHVKKDLEKYNMLPVNSVCINFTYVAVALQKDLDRYLRQQIRPQLPAFDDLFRGLDFESKNYCILESTYGEEFEIDIAWNVIPRILEEVPESSETSNLIPLAIYEHANKN